jgi:hypothetical protein
LTRRWSRCVSLRTAVPDRFMQRTRFQRWNASVCATATLPCLFKSIPALFLRSCGAHSGLRRLSDLRLIDWGHVVLAISATMTTTANRFASKKLVLCVRHTFHALWRK